MAMDALQHWLRSEQSVHGPHSSTGDPPPVEQSQTGDWPNDVAWDGSPLRPWDPNEAEEGLYAAAHLHPSSWSDVAAYLRDMSRYSLSYVQTFARRRYQQRVDDAQERVLNGIAAVAYRVYKQRLDRLESASRLKGQRRYPSARNVTQDAVWTVWFDAADRVIAVFRRLGASPPPESPR